MRKDAKRENERLELNTLQGYHSITNYNGNSESYAFQGYKKNLYFVSDRAQDLDENFRLLDGSEIKGYGLEIETNSNSIDSRSVAANVVKYVVYPLFPANLFKCQSDGSITGPEIITQVMTKAFIRNHYKDFKQLYNEVFPAFGFTCQNADCGMHVNISTALLGKDTEQRADNVRKLYYFINKNYDLCKVLFNRVNDTTYCHKMPYENAKNMNVHNMPSSHGNCFNGSHFDVGRIEIRLVGGQKDFACFRNTMETVFHLVDNIKSFTWKDMDDVTKVFKGCNNYVYDRLTKCRTQGVLTQSDLDIIAPTVKRVEYI